MDGERYTALFEAPGGRPVLKVYGDPLTGKDPWSVGLGHTGPDVREGDVWPEDRCLHAYSNDYGVACGIAAKVVGSSAWRTLSSPRQAVMVDLAFNIGASRLEGFAQMLTALRRGDWATAAAELLDSAYARQVKSRAQTNAKTLLTGEWP